MGRLSLGSDGVHGAVMEDLVGPEAQMPQAADASSTRREKRLPTVRCRGRNGVLPGRRRGARAAEGSDQIVINQALLLRQEISPNRGDSERAAAMLAQVELRLRAARELAAQTPAGP